MRKAFLPHRVSVVQTDVVTILIAVVLAVNFYNCKEATVEPKSTCKSFDLRGAEMVMKWNDQIQKAYTYPVGVGLPPPIISRLFAIYHTAMHDALNSIVPVYDTYASATINEAADPDAAVAQAVYDVLVAVGPSADARASIDSLFEVSMASVMPGPAKQAGIELGKSVAAAVLASRQLDAANIMLVGFNPTPPSGVEPGVYRYIPPLNYALAGFHLMQPWIMTSGSQFLVEPPDPIGSEGYVADYKEVMSLGELNSTARTADERALGIFWAENTSRGWNEVARQTMKVVEKNLNAWEAARLFALLHITIADAYISVFDSKMQYNYWRPISAIHGSDANAVPNNSGDTNWQATLATPPIGEYPSAHALTGSAAAKVLMRFYERDDIPFSLTSGYWPDKRSFKKISDAVRENSLSRIYIGYHFRKAVVVGEAKGYEIGDYVYDHALKNTGVVCVN